MWEIVPLALGPMRPPYLGASRRASVPGVRCPVCTNGETKVVDSRATDDDAIRRRRVCTSCEARFTTYERYEIAPIVVIKRSGRREEFDPAKIVRGLAMASKGRPITADQVEVLTAEVQDEARATMGEVTSEWVGRAVLDRLRVLDPVACLRFASVYKGFDDLGDFEREARLIKLDGS